MPRRQRRRPKHNVDPTSAVIDVFKTYDGDSSGKLNEEHLCDLLIGIGVPPAEVFELLVAFGSDGGGKIEYSSFVEWLFSAAPEALTRITESSSPILGSVLESRESSECGRSAEPWEEARQSSSTSTKDFRNSLPSDGLNFERDQDREEDAVVEKHAALTRTCVAPDHNCAWEWPLSRNEKKVRVEVLDRNLRMMDQNVLLQELAELRQFREDVLQLKGEALDSGSHHLVKTNSEFGINNSGAHVVSCMT
mmetsp:Transcript_58802/g.92993  ORF Transcript_58802/g.92993 Transcript_58802/m.92993 type:complete len:250 (+) Transcript_58802:35-784(+)